MALDAATLALAVGEIREKLLDARIAKIFEPTRDELLLTLRTRTETLALLLSARSGSARVCFTRESFENPDTPPGFCMLMRKYLTGGKVLDVRREPGDRIVYFDFQCTNEMGDLVTNTLCAELMGRYSNLVLVQNGRIVDALKRVDFEDSDVRQLLPGLAYTLPPKPARPDFFSVSSASLVAAACEKPLPVADALIKTVSGVGPVVSREAVWRAFGETAALAAELDAAQQARLAQAIDALRAEYEAGGTPVSVKAPEGRPVEYTFFRPQQYGAGFVLTEWPSFSEMLEGYYAEKDRAERLRTKGKELHKAVHNLYERAVRKQAARRDELAASEKSETLRLYGELLSANLYQMEKGMQRVTLPNWYDGGKEVTISLDARYSPSQNAQRYFKEYKKKQTAARMLAELLTSGEQEIAYLETVLYEVESASGEAALNEIRAELKSQGYLKYYKQRDKKQKPADFLRFVSSDGFEILVGRNNIQNERLTLHTARGRDLWFHTKNAPGSHTVVMSEGRAIPDRTKEEAAQLAVLFSSQAHGIKVPVDYTEVKNIRKTGGLKPGMVLYDLYETAYITPDAALAETLAKR
ncbi:MAG: NFACT family protein [Faecalibacterium sp.]|jgi:predicted ribosome quality control (RQC) complex YloA/Tae2 family protein|nr:NFACT family protein [Faecalibacterium sp.]